MHDVAMKQQCVEIVVTMIAMGATFKTHTGALGAETWTYELRDEATRQGCQHLLTAADRHRIGFNSAFIEAIKQANDQLM